MNLDPEIEQELARLRDMLPRYWWAIYQGSVDAGFTPEQSLQIVLTFVSAYAVGVWKK